MVRAPNVEQPTTMGSCSEQWSKRNLWALEGRHYCGFRNWVATPALDDLAGKESATLRRSDFHRLR